MASKIDDNKLFDFDQKRLDHFSKRDADRALREYPELYRNQLVIAKFLQGWHDRAGDGFLVNPDRADGIKWALKEVAAHLRQGDLLPSGILYRQTEEELSE